MPVQKIPLSWFVGPCPDPATKPERFVPAAVPGAVQLDWAKAIGIPLPDYAGNTADYRWMEDSFWLYRTALDIPALSPDKQAFFVCGGVDYRFEIHLDGVHLLTQEGMFTPIEIQLPASTPHGALLEILVYPAPKSHHKQDDRDQANRSAKPAVSYGWDFHPRLIPLGIWQDAWIEIRPACHLRNVETSYTLNESLTGADLELSVSLSQVGEGSLHWTLSNPAGEVVYTKTFPLDRTSSGLSGHLDHPLLWWPNGHGLQPLYTSRVELLDAAGQVVDARENRLGFRRFRLVRNVPDWNPEVDDFPRGPMVVPIVFEVNGRRIFARGSNWVSPDIFPGRISADTYRPLLQQARDANLNILRCWGGAIVQKEAFFDLCDELGLMVWQEFPLACNYYEGKEYLEVLDQESYNIIWRLRSHPSLVLWCGGNELFNVWSGGGMSEQDHAIRLLNKNTYELDPHRPFLSTAPLYGMGHGYYVFALPDGTELFEYLPKRHFAAYSEFGVPGPASAETIRKIIPPEEIFPPRPTPSWIARHAYGAWDGSPGSWLEFDFLNRYFGGISTLEEMVECGQFIQAEGLRFFFEEARRQSPTCSLAMNWCLNEPWPAAANSSLIEWPANPKPALQTVGQACRPVLASARPARLRWRAGEDFTADLFILNDSFDPLPAVQIQTAIILDGIEIPLIDWHFSGAAAGANLPGPQIRFTLPAMRSRRFQLALRVPGHPEWDSQYAFVLA